MRPYLFLPSAQFSRTPNTQTCYNACQHASYSLFSILSLNRVPKTSSDISVDRMTSATKNRKVFYGWWQVGACFFLLFLTSGAGFYSFGIFIKPLEEAFGWSRTSISLTMTISFVLGGIVAPVIGRWADTYGPKKIMPLSALAFGVCLLLGSFTNSLWYFYAIYALMAVGQAGMAAVPISTVLARWFVRRRGTAIAIAMVGIAAGGLVLAPLVGLITSHFGWRVSFVFLGLLVWAVALPITLFVIRGSPAEMGLLPDGDEPVTTVDPLPASQTATSVAAAAPRGWALATVLRTGAFKWTAAAFALAAMAQLGVLQHQVPFITDIGISESAAATALGLTAGMGGLGKLCFGRLSEILPVRYVAALSFGLQALGVLILLNTHTMAMVWVYVIVFGFGMGGIAVLLPLIVGELFSLAYFGVLFGALALAQTPGAAIGPVISGMTHDHLGTYHPAFIGFIGVYMAAIVAVLLARKPKL